MIIDLENDYNHVRSGGAGFYEQKRGLIAVWGNEAVQFLDGLITNNVKSLDDGSQMLAAFPNAQGRLLAVVRVLRQDDRFLFETEETTREKVFQNLFRFTFAGDFFVEDLSADHRYFELFDKQAEPPASAGGITFTSKSSRGYFATPDSAEEFRENAGVAVTPDIYEVLRIENGVPKYGVDMDETTIVPELGFDDMISYNKGCYIGQEIIARIHFRGHVAKQLIGLILADGDERFAFVASETLALQSVDGKNAGRITSATYSPQLQKTIALGYIRYDYLADGTKLIANEREVEVHSHPFMK